MSPDFAEENTSETQQINCLSSEVGNNQFRLSTLKPLGLRSHLFSKLSREAESVSPLFQSTEVDVFHLASFHEDGAKKGEG